MAGMDEWAAMGLSKRRERTVQNDTLAAGWGRGMTPLSSSSQAQQQRGCVGS